jgi:hypothetical protein
LDRDAVLEKNVMQSIINLPEIGESNIVVEPETKLEPEDSFLVVLVDVSSSNEVSDGDNESEASENHFYF